MKWTDRPPLHGGFKIKEMRQDFYGEQERVELYPKEQIYHDQRTGESPELLQHIASDYGFELVNVLPGHFRTSDPFVLYDRFGHIAHQWPENYEPDFTDVITTCKKLTT